MSSLLTAIFLFVAMGRGFGMICNQVHMHWDTYLICKIFEPTDIRNKIAINFSEPNYCIYNSTEYFGCNGDRIISLHFNNSISNGSLNANYAFPSNLTHLSLTHNELSFFNFSSVSNCLLLEEIHLDNNKLEGYLDVTDWDIVSAMSHLQIFTLNNNRKLGGKVAMSSGHALPLSICVFDLSFNHFTSIDWNILNISNEATFSRLEIFKINENEFIGTIDWDLFWNLHTIGQTNKESSVVRHLRFEDNNFHGNIDFDIFYDFMHLRNLDLSDNDFPGQIDFELVNYLFCHASLQRFHCDDSRFWGLVNFEELFECSNGNNGTFDIKIGEEVRCDSEMDSFSCDQDSLMRYEESCDAVDECLDSCACGVLCFQEQTHHDSYLLCSISQNTNIQSMIYQATGRDIWGGENVCAYSAFGAFFGFDFICTNDRITKLQWTGITVEGTMDTLNYHWPSELRFVDFHDNAVSGVFYTESIANLTKLWYADISGNNLTAEINWMHLQKLLALSILRLNSNSFMGTVDWNIISYLSLEGNLSEINIKDNEFYGFADFRNISSALQIAMDTTVRCDPAIYCKNTSRILSISVDRASVECVGKIECEKTCQCERISVLYTTTEAQSFIVTDAIGTTFYVVLAVSLVLICAVIIVVAKIIKSRSIKYEDISNPLVVIISIGDYDDEQTTEPVDIETGVLMDLPVEKDVQNLKALFRQLNYKVIPQRTTLRWTQQDVLTFIKESENELFVDSNCDQLKHDALIVCVSCHGVEEHIVTSDYCTIHKTAIHRMYSLRHPLTREIPRIFLFDACGGNAERGRPKHFRSISPTNEKEFGEISNVSPENDSQIEMGKYFGMDDLNKQRSTALHNTWTTQNKNPDFKLVEIHAANSGFQAKLDIRKGSYLLFEFAKRMKENLEGNNDMTLGDIFDSIQSDLHNGGKQQTVNVFNNATRNIRLKVNEDELELNSPLPVSPGNTGPIIVENELFID